MRKTVALILSIIIFCSCIQSSSVEKANAKDWSKRTVKNINADNLVKGSTYLSVYSQVYSQTEKKTHDLTATVSLRNTSRKDTLFIDAADYFDTHGSLIQSYIEKPIFIAPMETIEIVIKEIDKTGGTGANFVFDWSTTSNAPEPIFEAVMISTLGQQGLSFVTHGQRIK